MKSRLRKNPGRKTGAFQTGTVTGKFDMLAELPSIDGSHWQLCLHPLEHRRALNPDLGTLPENGGGNPFFNPAFLAASRDRVTRNQIFQLILWEIEGQEHHARLALPVFHLPGTLLVAEHFRSLTHPYAPYGNPLMLSGQEDNLATRFAGLLETAFERGMPPLVIDHVPEYSPLMRISALNGGKIGMEAINLGARASINPGPNGAAQDLMSKKRRREFNRLLRKLQEQGTLTFEKVVEPLDVILRFEEFLLLETRSWKGKGGTSIHTIKRDAAFARQSVCDMARQGKCEIYSMRLDNKVLASTILFKSSGHYFPWKTAFDSSYAAYSPGSQLMLRLTEDIMARADFIRADSLAKFGNSWMTALWPDQTAYSRLVIAKSALEAEAISLRLQLLDRSKRMLKKILRRG